MMTKIGVGIIIVNKGKVLLGKRLSSHGYGTWSFPGGKPDASESLETCAIRETEEETGLIINNLLPVATTEDYFPEQIYKTYFYICNHPGGTPKVMEPDKCEEWRWFEWNALPEPLFKPILNLIKNGFSENALVEFIAKLKI